MGRKGGKYKRKEIGSSTKKTKVSFNSDGEDLMDDEIDAFHKQRDVVSLRLNDDVEDSDEDNDHPVFDVEEEGEEEDDDDDDDMNNDLENDDIPPKGLAAKIHRTQKYLRSKFGGVEDENLEDSDEEEKRIVWGGKKVMYGADVDYEPMASDDEEAAEEEAEVLKLQSEKAKGLSMEDFGLEDVHNNDTDEERTLEEILDHGKHASKTSSKKEIKDESGLPYEIVEKDINALSKEEQMDFVYSTAPELVGLLSELNSAFDQLENKINPLVGKIREHNSNKKGEMHYIEVKQLLLQSFCQAITFYLLLKSEGQPVRDHPVVSRLVEIKSLLDKMHELDENFPFDIEDTVSKHVDNATPLKLDEKTGTKDSNSVNEGLIAAMSSEKHVPDEATDLDELNTVKSSKNMESRCKFQDKRIGAQSMEMLKVRAALEEKLKQRNIFSSVVSKNVRVTEHLLPVNKQFETLDDFDDEAMDVDSRAYNRSNGDVGQSNKLSQELSLRPNKRKVISGDDDIPKRDDIGERRRKHELRVLAGAGIGAVDDVEGDEPDNLSSDGVAKSNEERDLDSDLEYYKQVEQKHAATRADKSKKYSRTLEVPPYMPDTVEGKRLITRQIEKNRGLTPHRKKETKNPRKKYKLKHRKAEIRRKGQVRDIRQPSSHYGGEASGINATISHSIRFKS